MGADGWVRFYDREKLAKVLTEYFPKMSEYKTWPEILAIYAYNENVVVRYVEIGLDKEYYKDWLWWIISDRLDIDIHELNWDSPEIEGINGCLMKEVMVWT